MGSTNCSFSNNHLRRPSRRVEVSPPPSPEFPRSRFNCSTLRYGTYSHPGHSQSHRFSGTLLDRSFGSDSFHRYAFSEMPRPMWPQTSTAGHGSFRRTSFRQTAAAPQFANAAFQQNGEYDSRWGHNQSVAKQDKHTFQGQGGTMMLGATQTDEAMSWLAQMRRAAQQQSMRKSYPPSVISMEVDTGRPMEVDLPIQQIQAENVTTL